MAAGAVAAVVAVVDERTYARFFACTDGSADSLVRAQCRNAADADKAVRAPIQFIGSVRRRPRISRTVPQRLVSAPGSRSIFWRSPPITFLMLLLRINKNWNCSPPTSH